MHKISRVRFAGAVALLLAQACASQPQPAGTWFRRHDLFFCDWEGGHNQGSLSFISNGNFAERFDFDGHGRKYSTDAIGHWTIKGDKITLDLDAATGRGERAPSSQKMRLQFTAAQHSSVLQLTLTEVVHEDIGEPRSVIEIPADERCTAVFEKAAKPRAWRRALAAMGLRSKSDSSSRSDG